MLENVSSSDPVVSSNSSSVTDAAEASKREKKSLNFGNSVKHKRAPQAERRISNQGAQGGYANSFNSPLASANQYETINYNQVTSSHDFVKNNFNHWTNNQHHHGNFQLSSSISIFLFSYFYMKIIKYLAVYYRQTIDLAGTVVLDNAFCSFSYQPRNNKMKGV